MADLRIRSFSFNPYQENTFVIADDSGACAIIDPGCYAGHERDTLKRHIEEEGLEVKYLLNTHGHIDHMLGNHFVKETWEVPFVTHKKVVPELEACPAYGGAMGLTVTPSPAPDKFVDAGDVIELGGITLKVLFTPGHSAGHISFHHEESNNLFSGDVLFQGSIGRTDLPGGDYETLMKSITEQLLLLSDETRVWCGHGPHTTIGAERKGNPFVLDYTSGSRRYG